MNPLTMDQNSSNNESRMPKKWPGKPVTAGIKY